MSTFNELTFSILDSVKPGNMTSSLITEELVQYHINTVRAQLAKQTIAKNGTLPSQYIQSLGCVELEKADPSECCEYPTGCVILRTSIEIPDMIDGNTSLITRVGPVNITERSYQQVEFERVPFEGLNRYTKHLIKWFISNSSNYVYLLMNMEDYLLASLEIINIQGAFSNPMDVSEFVTCSDESCFSADSFYPIPDSMVPTLQEMVIKKFVLPQSQMPVDSTNDNKENSQTTISKGE